MTEAPTVTRSNAAHVLAATSLFIAVYLGFFVSVGFAASAFGIRTHYWIALGSAAFATWFAVRVMEQGRWSVGFFVAPRLAAGESAVGLLFAAIVIGAGGAIIVGATPLDEVRGSGFPWRELSIIFIPAAVHEELVFRGYVFQRLRAWNRTAAIALTSFVFASLHAANEGVTTIALANLVIAGILLALAYERYERLWFPIGIHLGWNVLSGPVLGFDVSGFVGRSSVLRVTGHGPVWLSGGSFGIEGSAVMTLVEIAATAALVLTNPKVR